MEIRESWNKLNFKILSWMTNSYRLELSTWRYQFWTPVVANICDRGCAYTVLQTVKRYEVYSAAYDTLYCAL